MLYRLSDMRMICDVSSIRVIFIPLRGLHAMKYHAPILYEATKIFNFSTIIFASFRSDRVSYRCFLICFYKSDFASEFYVYGYFKSIRDKRDIEVI